eukprot:1353207-Rhodomonas_salina.2
MQRRVRAVTGTLHRGPLALAVVPGRRRGDRKRFGLRVEDFGGGGEVWHGGEGQTTWAEAEGAVRGGWLC